MLIFMPMKANVLLTTSQEIMHANSMLNTNSANSMLMNANFSNW